MKKSPHRQNKVIDMSTTPPGTLSIASWAFWSSMRVLAQAADPNVPLLERLKFICIVSSNLTNSLRSGWRV
jgi:polyphosphate kinase